MFQQLIELWPSTPISLPSLHLTYVCVECTIYRRFGADRAFGLELDLGTSPAFQLHRFGVFIAEPVRDKTLSPDSHLNGILTRRNIQVEYSIIARLGFELLTVVLSESHNLRVCYRCRKSDLPSD